MDVPYHLRPQCLQRYGGGDRPYISIERDRNRSIMDYGITLPQKLSLTHINVDANIQFTQLTQLKCDLYTLSNLHVPLPLPISREDGRLRYGHVAQSESVRTGCAVTLGASKQTGCGKVMYALFGRETGRFERYKGLAEDPRPLSSSSHSETHIPHVLHSTIPKLDTTSSDGPTESHTICQYCCSKTSHPSNHLEVHDTAIG
jgi:hypothetical protein